MNATNAVKRPPTPKTRRRRALRRALRWEIADAADLLNVAELAILRANLPLWARRTDREFLDRVILQTQITAAARAGDVETLVHFRMPNWTTLRDDSKRLEAIKTALMVRGMARAFTQVAVA